MTRPDGSKREIVVSDRGGAIFTETELAGTYHVEGKNYPTYLFAANLVSASESDTTPHKSLSILDNANQTPGKQVPTPYPLLPYVAIVALILLLVEWYAFHRRIHLN